MVILLHFAILVQLDVGVGLSTHITRSVMFSISKIGHPSPPAPLDRQVIFPSMRQLALVEMRDQLRNYFRWLTEANRFGEWYKIWHYKQFVAAQSHLEHVYGIPFFVSEESLPPLDYKWDISTDMWLDGTRARLICPRLFLQRFPYVSRTT